LLNFFGQVPPLTDGVARLGRALHVDGRGLLRQVARPLRDEVLLPALPHLLHLALLGLLGHHPQGFGIFDEQMLLGRTLFKLFICKQLFFAHGDLLVAVEQGMLLPGVDLAHDGGVQADEFRMTLLLAIV